MHETLTVSTWNLKGALSDPARATEALDALEKTKADVITLPDAWHEDSQDSVPTERKLEISTEALRARGFYAIQSTFREDRADDNFARYGFMTLYRAEHPPVSHRELQLGTRPAHHLQFKLGRKTLHYISLYLSDQSEQHRSAQVSDLVSHLAAYESEPTILAGDFNALHKTSGMARILRSAPFKALFGDIGAFNNTFPRLIDMAKGSTLDRLALHDFQDAEPYNLATMPSRLPLFQLDHFMKRDGHNTALDVAQPIRVHHADISDHLQLVTKVTIKNSP